MCFRHKNSFFPSPGAVVVLSLLSTGVVGRYGGREINGDLGYNKFGLPSLIVPVPCQASILSEQVNYICMKGGKILCLPGWKNPENYCRDPECPDECAGERGMCNQPNECTCRNGFFGRLCQHTLPFPGCMHGKPDRPFTCICDEGWKGIKCDQAICREGCNRDTGFCIEPDTCICTEDYEGRNCTECKKLPGCLHGTCDMPMQCNCLEGWRGAHCDEPKCHPNCVPPFGRCQAPNKCVCETGYSGDNCQECQTYPGCQNGTCHMSEYGVKVPWSCKCNPGWMGMLCDQPKDPNIPATVADNMQGTMGLNDYRHRYQWPRAGNFNSPPARESSAKKLQEQLKQMGKIDNLFG